MGAKNKQGSNHRTTVFRVWVSVVFFFFNQLIYILINKRRGKWPISFPRHRRLIKIMKESFKTEREQPYDCWETTARLSWEEKDSEFY